MTVQKQKSTSCRSALVTLKAKQGAERYVDVLTFGGPSHSHWQALLLWNLHKIALVVYSPSRNGASIKTHVDFLKREWAICSNSAKTRHFITRKHRTTARIANNSKSISENFYIINLSGYISLTSFRVYLATFLDLNLETVPHQTS